MSEQGNDSNGCVAGLISFLLLTGAGYALITQQEEMAPRGYLAIVIFLGVCPIAYRILSGYNLSKNIAEDRKNVETRKENVGMVLGPFGAVGFFGSAIALI